jgi:hypothetical protein
MTAETEVRNDSTTLFQFVYRIATLCERQRGPQTYDIASRTFLDYIRDLGNATLVYLDRFAESVPTSDPVLFYAHRQKLWNLRSNWNILHSFVKPAKDADTLRAPASLIAALTRRVAQIAGFENTKFAVFHTDELNYLHLNIDKIRGLAQMLSSLIPNGPSFPPDLGLIGIPYSQAAACQPNSLLGHEMGHYVYQEKTNRGELAELQRRLREAPAEALKPIMASITAQDVEWCFLRLSSWAQELFCDLFASRLVGPTYSFAYLEIFDLALILDPSGNPLIRESIFSMSHPADVFRLREQCRMLDKVGWWNTVKNTQSHHLRALEMTRSVADNKFVAPPTVVPDLGRRTLQAFIDVTPTIHEAVENTLSAVDSGIADFVEFETAIRAHLVRGIVPSTIIVDGERKYPGPVALINAAHRFCLERLDDLVAGIEGEDKTSARTRSVWMERVELWTLKALEDNQLLTQQSG